MCVIVGEASGDAQAAPVVQCLQNLIKSTLGCSVHFWGAAGPRLRDVGVEAVVRTEDLAVMGFAEIVGSYLGISSAYKTLWREVLRRKPKALICVDYPGFNLKFIQDAYVANVTTLYHIPPKVWAHGKSRALILKDYTYLVTSILPFESKYLSKLGVASSFVGNPLCDSAREFLKHDTSQLPRDAIGLLPGSRTSELDRHVPLLVAAFAQLQGQVKTQMGQENLMAQVPVAVTLETESMRERFVRAAMEVGKDAQWVNNFFRFEKGNISQSLQRCQYAWVCSGTATLETAFHQVPHAVVYKTSTLTWEIGRRLVTDISFVGLSNLCAGREVAKEFLQSQATPDNLVQHALLLLTDSKKYQLNKGELAELSKLFPENASERAAQKFLETISKFDLDSEVKLRLQRNVGGRLG